MLDRSVMAADVKEKPAGLMMDGVGGLARGGGEPASALRMRGRIGGGGRKTESSQGINGLLTITIY